MRRLSVGCGEGIVREALVSKRIPILGLGQPTLAKAKGSRGIVMFLCCNSVDWSSTELRILREPIKCPGFREKFDKKSWLLG